MKALPRSDWPVNMSIRDCLDCYMAQSTVDGTPHEPASKPGSSILCGFCLGP